MKTMYTLEGTKQNGASSAVDCASAQSPLSLSLSVSAPAFRTHSPKAVSSRLYFGRLMLISGARAMQP